jgi:hypothetical protein
MSGVLGSIASWLGANEYPAYSLCLSNSPEMIFAFLLTYGVMSVSYVLIGTVLLLNQPAAIRAMVGHRLGFGAFIVLCGVSHFTNALTLYSGVYLLKILVMTATASVSAMTAGLTVYEWRRGK